MARRLSRRPILSPGIAANMDPRIVPHSATETVSPKAAGESVKVSVSACVVPAMTAVSNPKSKPPKGCNHSAFQEIEIKFHIAFLKTSVIPPIIIFATGGPAVTRNCKRVGTRKNAKLEMLTDLAEEMRGAGMPSTAAKLDHSGLAKKHSSWRAYIIHVPQGFGRIDAPRHPCNNGS